MSSPQTGPETNIAEKPARIQALWEFVGLGKVLLVNNRRQTLKLLVELESALRSRGCELSPDMRKRISAYTVQSAVTNHWFGMLRGKKATPEEVRDGLYFGAFTPAADDLMDSTGRTYAELPGLQDAETAEEILFAYLQDKLVALHEKNPVFHNYFVKAEAAQNESLRQMGKDRISEEDLKQITFDKGGYSTLLYRSLLQNPLSPGEEEAIYTLGSLLQLENDLFDLYKDHRNGAQTLVTVTADMHRIAKLMRQLEMEFKDRYFSLGYAEAAKKRSFRAIRIVIARSAVALDQYLRLQGDSGRVDVEAYPRKAWIVDMEKAGNFPRYFRAASRDISL